MSLGPALVMIEFQNEWLDGAGRLNGLFQDRSLLADAVGNAAKALAAARSAKIPVVHTAMGFSPDYRELGQTDFGMRGAIAHHRTWRGSGREFAAGFGPQNGELAVDRKVAASAFTSTPLDTYLRNQRVERIYLAGFALHVCVSATGWSAHDLGYEVVVLEDACAAFTRAQQQFTLHEVAHHFGKVESVATFQATLGERRDH
jgi:nicotinamidase-related amidase